MTCIVAVKDGDRLVFGGDSSAASTGSGNSRLVVRPKIFSRKVSAEQFLIGYTSSFRMGQVLEHVLDIPSAEEDDDEVSYMVTKFVPACREAFKGEGVEPGFFLVGWRARIFDVQTDWQVNEFTDGFGSVGCADQLALGALATVAGKVPAENAVLRALQAASRFNAFVRPPFHFLDNKGQSWQENG